MRRMVWVAVGAVGGVVVYRRAQALLADARERGLVVSAQQAGVSAMSALATARQLAAAATEQRPASRTPGSAAGKALRTGSGDATMQGDE